MEYYHIDILPDSEPTPPARSWWKESIETVVLALVLFVIINAISSRIQVDSVSMFPTLHEKDFVLVNKLAYLFSQPRRGDIVVFKNPHDKKAIPLIKRIVGLPGETVEVRDGQVYINGAELTEPYLKVLTLSNGSWSVPEGHWFMMGDNRQNSSDSRTGWTVPRADIIGKAEFIYFPVSHWAILHQTSAAQAAAPSP